MRQTLLILFFLVSAFVSKAQNVNVGLYGIDTTDLTLRIDGNIIVINKNISDKQEWANLFTDDHLFIDYFKNNSGKAMYVYINEIEILDSVTFRFKILSRSVAIKTYQPNGWCNYVIKRGVNPISKKTSITKIELRGCEI